MYNHGRKTYFIQMFVTSKGNRIYHSEPGPNRYYAEIKPFLFMLRLIGRFPYSIPANGPIRFQLFSFPTLYSMAFYTTQAYWTINTLKMVYRIRKQASYDDTLFSILFTVFLLHNVVTPFTHWMQGLKVISYIESWQQCQNELRFVGVDLSKKLLMRFIVTGVLPGAMLVVSIGTYVLKNLPFECMVPFVISVIATELSLNLWCIALGYIEIISKEMLRKFIENKYRDLTMLRKVWMRLCRQLSGLGDKMAHIIVVTAIVLFVTFLLSLYGVLAYLFRFSVAASSLWGFVGGCLSCILVHYIFCNVAHETSQELGRRFTSKFLMIDFSTQSKEYLTELMLLLQTMESNAPVISVFGFITVSRRIFVSFITNAITYLVVLVQFKVCDLAHSVRA